MKVGQGKVVILDYQLSEGGELLETTHGSESFVYLHGVNGIIPGLENALAGRQQGDQFSVTIAPEEAYGEHEQGMTQQVSKEMFGDNPVSLGQQFHAKTNHGAQVVTVTDIAGDTVTIDGNHPLAGKTLTFDVSITEVRDATPEELQHRHVHGAGGCGH